MTRQEFIDALREAQEKDVPQCQGVFTDGHGAFCATGYALSKVPGIEFKQDPSVGLEEDGFAPVPFLNGEALHDSFEVALVLGLSTKEYLWVTGSNDYDERTFGEIASVMLEEPS